MRCGSKRSVVCLAAALALLLMTTLVSAQQAQTYNLRPQWGSGPDHALRDLEQPEPGSHDQCCRAETQQ